VDGGKVSIIRDENQQPVNIIGLTRDITERKEKDDLIKILNEQQQIILDASPAMIFYKDKEIVLSVLMSRWPGRMVSPRKRWKEKPVGISFPGSGREYWQTQEVMMTARRIILLKRWKPPRGLCGFQTDKIPYRIQKGDHRYCWFYHEYHRSQAGGGSTAEEWGKYRTVLENIQEGFLKLILLETSPSSTIQYAKSLVFPGRNDGYE